MAGRDRLRSIGLRRGRQLAETLGDAIREHRLSQGLTRRFLATALGISVSKLGRWERAEPPYPDIVELCVTLRLLGQDLTAKLFPAGGALRDDGHARLVGAFLRLVSPMVPRRIEDPMPRFGDLRAWDVSLTLGSARAGVTVETNLRDSQALLRREELKMRDSGMDRLILVLADTHANREAVARARVVLRDALPLDGRAILRALREGRDPGAGGILFLSAGRSVKP